MRKALPAAAPALVAALLLALLLPTVATSTPAGQRFGGGVPQAGGDGPLDALTYR